MDIAQALAQIRQRDSAAPPVWETAVAQGGPDGMWVDINASGVVERAACPISITPHAGDVVAVIRAGIALVVGILALASADSPDLGPAPVNGAPSSGVSYFPALYTYTWESNNVYPGIPDGTTVERFSGLTDLSQGSTWPGPLPYRRGYWFYNWTVTAALAGATVDAARIRLPRSTNGPDTATVTLTFRDIQTIWPPQAGDTGPYGDVPAEPINGGSAVTVVSAPIGRGGATWTDIDPTMVQYMVDAQIGPDLFIPPPLIGIDGPDDLTLQGLQSDPQSGLLEITWHR